MNITRSPTRPVAAAALLISALLLRLSCAAAQNIDFHPPVTATDAATPAAMRDLAARVLPVYQEGDPERYLANLSAIQLVAGNFTAAADARQSLVDRRRAVDARRPAGKGVFYAIYARAKVLENRDHIAFAQAFTQAYRDAVPKLNDRDEYALAGWFEAGPSAFQDALQKAFDQHRANGSLALSEAIDLINTYLTFDAYRSFAPLVASLDADEERRRYSSEDDIQVPTSGGARLSVKLVRPRGAPQALPALLEFSIDADAPQYAKECAAHGYVGVVAYGRGRLKGGEKLVPFQFDGEDARAVIEWIARQPWSDGRVGMYGTGYSGFAQWAAAKRLPPALKAIAPSSATAPGIDVPMEGGIFQNSAYRWVYGLSGMPGSGKNDAAQWRALDQSWYASGRPYRELDSIAGKHNPLFTRWLNHPSYDRFWQKMVPFRDEFATIDIPVLSITGYFATGEVGSLYYFAQHYRYNPHAAHTLLIGPYDDSVMQHGAAPLIKGYSIDPAALVDLREVRYQWFDSVLKGEAAPDLLQGRVNYEVMGANEWRHVGSLAGMTRGTQRYYLESRVTGDGHLLAQRKTAESFVRQRVNFADRSDASWTAPPGIVGKDLQSHHGVTYISEPLRHPMQFNGLFSGRLDFTVSRMDVDLNLTFYELLPSGEYLQLFDPAYSLRASYARDRGHRHLLRAGERQQLNLRSERLTSRRLEAGSRLVVVLAVTKRADQEINYGGGGDVSAESLNDNRVPLTIKWFNSSYLDIPLHR